MKVRDVLILAEAAGDMYEGRAFYDTQGQVNEIDFLVLPLSSEKNL